MIAFWPAPERTAKFCVNLIYGFAFLTGLVGDGVALTKYRPPISSWQDFGGKHRKSFRTTGALVLCVLLTIFCSVGRAEELVYDIEVPSMNAAEALNRFAEQTGAIMLFPYDLASARQANEVNGRYTLLEGLDLLLRNTGLSGGLSDRRVVNISLVEDEQRPTGEAGMAEKKVPLVRKIGAFLASLASVSAASGQETDVGPQVLDEIIVTAQKREESLQEVPISATVFNQAALERLGALRIKDLEFNVPNLVFTGRTLNVNSSITMRGISSNTRNMGFDAGISIYVDGVYTGRSFTFNQDLLDIERVEVLRGPQGTLFGKNTIAGAISITTRKPEGTFGGSLSLDVGNYEYRSLRGSVNVPLVEDRLYSKLSLFSTDRDGFVTNVFDGVSLDTEDSWGGRLQFRALPSDKLEINISLDGMIDQRKPTAPDIVGGIGSMPNAPPFVVSLDVSPQSDRELYGATMLADYELDSGAVLSSVTGWKSARVFFLNDGDGSEVPQFGVEFADSSDHFSQELRLASPSDQRLQYVLGLYYLSQDVSTDRLVEFFTAFPLPGTRLVNIGSVKTDSYGAFTHFSFAATERVSIDAGVRYTREEKELDFDQISDGLFEILGQIPDLSDIRRDRVDTDFSPMVSLNWAVTPEMMIYGKYARGFKSGGFNADFIAQVDDRIEFGPEQADTLEAGMKSEFFDRRLRVNVAAFWMDYSDLQISTYIPELDVFEISNAASSRVRGMEIDFSARPTADLLLHGGFGYVNAEFKDYQTSPTTNLSGNELERVPKTTWNFSAQYERDIAIGALIGRVGVQHRDSWFGSPDNNPANETPAFTIYNARLAYVPTDANWEVALWAKNLTDELYAVSRNTRALPLSPVQFLAISRGAPRTYGLAVNFRF